MRENFDNAFKFICFSEAGPNETKWTHTVAGDPGGLTIYGITAESWPKEVAAMSKMSQMEARAYARQFYLSQYWTVLDCDSLPFGMDVVIFDIGVNQGAAKAREIQKKAYNWQDALILRSDKWDDLDTLYNRFGKGWSKRMSSLRDYITSRFTVLEWDRKELISAYPELTESPVVVKESYEEVFTAKEVEGWNTFKKLKWLFKGKTILKEAKMKPGVHTSELWVAVVAAGVVFCNKYLGWGLSETDVITFLTPIMGYIVNRMAVKLKNGG